MTNVEYTSDRVDEQEKREKVVALLKRYMMTPNLAGAENYGAKIVDMPAPLIADAISLLKAQEPVKPKVIDTSTSKLYHSDMFKNYYCGNCGEFLHVVNRRDMFCSQCGRKVKW